MPKRSQGHDSYYKKTNAHTENQASKKTNNINAYKKNDATIAMLTKRL